MEHSLIKEIDKKSVDAYLDKRTWPAMLFETFFPFKFSPFLKYETIIGGNNQPVAADVVAYNASAPRKTRQVIDKLRGEIPAIRIMRTMEESDINDYNVMSAMVAMTDGADKKQRQQEILRMVYDDIEFAINGCLSRLEWLAITAMSSTNISLSSSTNNGLVTETVIDFQMPATNKRKIASATGTRVWDNGTITNYLPITDIEVLTQAAEDLGYSIKYLIMNRAKWLQFRAATEVVQFIWNATTAVNKPTVQQVNDRLAQDGLPQIIVINPGVRIETSEHSISTVHPWTTANVLAIPETQLGNTLFGPMAAETNPPKQAIQSKSKNVLVQKYSDTNPVAEHTVGMINAFPSWENINACFLFDTEATPEADGLDD